MREGGRGWGGGGGGGVQQLGQHGDIRRRQRGKGGERLREGVG